MVKCCYYKKKLYSFLWIIPKIYKNIILRVIENNNGGVKYMYATF